jgi:hypothetical protein
MVSSSIGLRSTLAGLASTTWTNIADGRQLGVPMGEVGITDHNMLALRREHPSLLIHKHPVQEEVLTGADWEWWLGTPHGWTCLVFQAKILHANGRYSGITKGREAGNLQVDVLVRSCLRRSDKLNGSVWPLYCFYNSWEGGWPSGIESFDGTDPRPMSAKELQLYGCAVANAWWVRQVLLNPAYSNRYTVRNSYLPISRPWSMIFPDSADPTAHSPQELSATMSTWMFGRQTQLSGNRDELKPRSVMRRDRLAIYRRPAVISEPPEYVLDLLEGRVRPRRLRPLGRRVAVLPDFP